MKRAKTEYVCPAGIPNHYNCSYKIPINDIREVDEPGPWIIKKNKK